MPEPLSLSPDGDRVAWGSTAIRVAPTVPWPPRDADVTLVNADGWGPRWADQGVLYYGRWSRDGPWLRATVQPDGRWVSEPVTAEGQNAWSVAGLLWGAVRAADRTIRWRDASPTENANNPAVNARGDRAYTTWEGVLEIPGVRLRRTHADARELRWARRDPWLLWSEAGVLYDWDDGEDRDQPLNIDPAIPEGDPVPLVVLGDHQWILSTQRNRTILRPRGSVFGYILASAGNQYTPDAVVVDPWTIRVAWSTADGRIILVDQPLDTPMVDLRQATPGPIDPDPEPTMVRATIESYLPGPGGVSAIARVTDGEARTFIWEWRTPGGSWSTARYGGTRPGTDRTFLYPFPPGRYQIRLRTWGPLGPPHDEDLSGPRDVTVAAAPGPAPVTVGLTRDQQRDFADRLETQYATDPVRHPPHQVTIHTNDGTETWWRELERRMSRGESYGDASAWCLTEIRRIMGQPGGGGGGGTPGPDPGPVLVQPLHADDVDLRREDGTILKVRGVSGFQGFQHFLEGRLDQLTAFAAWMRGQRINAWTFFCMWRVTGFDPRAYGPSYYDRFVDFQRWIAAQGFHPNPIRFCDQVSGSPVLLNPDERDAHDARIRERLLPYTFDELVNEDWKNGQLAHRLTPGPLTSRSAFEDGQGWDQPGPLAAWTSQQFARKFQWARGAKNLLETSRLGLSDPPVLGKTPTRKPAVAREPPLGIFESTIPWSRTDDAAGFAAFHATAELYGAGSVLHGDLANLQSCTVPGPRAQACADAVTAVWEAGIPAEAARHGVYTRGGLDAHPLVFADRYDPDGPEDREINPAGSLRDFTMLQGDRATVVVVQPGDAWRAQPRDGWRITRSVGPVLFLER